MTNGKRHNKPDGTECHYLAETHCNKCGAVLTERIAPPPWTNTYLDDNTGWCYRASNVHKCTNLKCQSHLMKRKPSWPPDQWQCDKCNHVQGGPSVAKLQDIIP